MFREIRDHIINIVTSRLTVLMILFAFFAGVLLYRCFNLQIVNGEEYLNDFILQIEKTRDISSTRGRILDRNGNVLAENELAYSVKIEDVFESSRNKNAEVNDVVYRLIKLIEKNGDSVITDFKIVIDEDGDYVYSVNGTALLRFQADVLGYKTVDKLSEEEKAAIETAIKEAEEAHRGNDVEVIKAKTEALATASQKLGEKVYAKQQAANAQQGDAAAAGEPAGSGSAHGAGDDVVDAEFTEVNDKK